MSAIAVEHGPPDRLEIVAVRGERIETEVEHQGDGGRVVRVRPVGDQSHLIVREGADDGRMLGDDGLGGGAIGRGARREQALRGRGVTLEQRQHVVEAEHAGGVHRRRVVVEHPAVDVAAMTADFLARQHLIAFADAAYLP